MGKVKAHLRVRLVGSMGVVDCPWVEVEVHSGDSITIEQNIDLQWVSPTRVLAITEPITDGRTAYPKRIEGWTNEQQR